MSAVYEYVGNLHMHTPYSDGEKWHKAIADAAIAAGLDFIVVTDHNIWVDGVEGYYENDQGRVLLLVGEEVHDTRRDPQCNHFLVYGAGEEMCRHSPDPQSLINATRTLGACGFLAHPHERSLDLLHEPELGWHNWEVDGFTGLEIWNYMSSFKSALARRHDRLSFKHPLIAKLSALRLVLRPEKYITGPEPETLAKWDELLAQGKRIAAVGNSDAHGTPMSLGPITREVFPYEFLFRAVNTHVLTRQPLNGDLAHDKALLLGAVGQGNSWVGYDMPASTKGFPDCTSQRPGREQRHHGGHDHHGRGRDATGVGPQPLPDAPHPPRRGGSGNKRHHPHAHPRGRRGVPCRSACPLPGSGTRLDIQQSHLFALTPRGKACHP